jgi:hypothetical protein
MRESEVIPISEVCSTARTAVEKVSGLPQLLLRRNQAASMLGISTDSFERYIESQIKLVLVGSMRLVPVNELERFVEENAAFHGAAA